MLLFPNQLHHLLPLPLQYTSIILASKSPRLVGRTARNNHAFAICTGLDRYGRQYLGSAV
jgi:hypothetical protein